MIWNGSKMKAARLEAGLLAKDLAVLADISPKTVWNYENGAKVPNVNRALCICVVLDCSIDDLIGEDGDE